MSAIIARFRNRTPSLLPGRLLLAALLVATTGTSALAQRYLSHQPTLDEREARFLYRDISAAFRNPADFQANREKINEYFSKYYFRKMTLYSPAALAELESMRDDLFKRFLRNASVEAAQEHLTGLTLSAMRVLARRNYHPAVRYNAVLILGMLDRQYTSGDQPPVPLEAAVEELLALLESEEFDDVKVPYALKVGALIGLERHAKIGLPNQYVERAKQAAKAMIEMEQPEDVEVDVVNWGRYAAARVLARQYKTAPPAEIQTILTQLINSEQLSLEDRCAVASLMANIDYTGAEEFDENASVLALGNLTQQAVDEEAKLAREYKDQLYEEGGRGGRGGRSLYATRGQRDTGPKLARRRLLTRLVYIGRGGLSLQKGLSEDAKTQLNNLIAPLGPVVNLTADENQHDLDVADAVIQLESTIDNVVASWQAQGG